MLSNSSYNHLDIERYLQQQMTPAEMHTFEKTMLEDPFLADAMEGFAAANAAITQKHLNQVEHEILGQHEKAKVVSFAQRKTSWWQVAAIVLVLISAGIITYRITNPTNTSLAQAEVEAVAKSSTKIKADTIGPAEVNPQTINAEKRDAFIASNKNSSPIIYPNKSIGRQLQSVGSKDTAVIVMEDKSMVTALLAEEQATKANAVAKESASRTMAAAPAIPAYEFIGKVVDPTGEPVSFATIKSEGTSIGAITDAKGNFKFKSPDSIVSVSVQSLGFAKAKARLKSLETAGTITLQEEQGDLADVVVTTMTSAKRNASAASITTAEPIGGWNNFNEYMNKRLDSFKTANHYISDVNISLEFDIDRKGKPIDVTITNNADKLIGKKATELLQNGPRWRQNGTKEKMKVSISLK